jgi:hypothetical protein
VCVAVLVLLFVGPSRAWSLQDHIPDVDRT